MKLTWDEVKEYFEENYIFADGGEQHWYRYMWEFLGDNRLTEYYSLAEKIAVFGRVYALIKIYREFCEQAIEENADFDFYPPNLVEEESGEVQEFVGGLIKDGGAARSVFKIAKEKIGVDKFFASLWITLDSSGYEGESIENRDDFNRVLTNYMNDTMNGGITSGKMAAYEWLVNNMQ